MSRSAALIHGLDYARNEGGRVADASHHTRDHLPYEL